MMVNIQNLEKSYHQGESKLQILKGVNLQLSAGQSCAIVGQSGSGKSTLLSLLAGLDSADAGEIWIAQQAFHQRTELQRTRLRRELLSIIFQQYHLVDTLTALENVALPLMINGADEAEARSILSKVGLAHRQDHFPSMLSGGEQQRVAIARALATRPQLILADEPSGSLDVETGRQVMDLMFRLCKESGATLILVTHDLDLARRCDMTRSLRDGQLV